MTGTTWRNEWAALTVFADGTAQLVDGATGADVSMGKPVASVTAAGREYWASAAEPTGEQRLRLRFSPADVEVWLRLTAQPTHFLVTVEKVAGTNVETVLFFHLPLRLRGTEDEPFAACALALNLQTEVKEFPGRNSCIRALGHSRFGFQGARIALVACPFARMRAILQDIVRSTPDLPHSPLGGPWAMDAEMTRGSYLFNFGGVTEQTVDRWIALARALGFTQMDFHGGQSFRFGDCEVNRAMYPDGRKSLKAVIDRLHAAGIAAGLHTYSHFVDKQSRWVTPWPDPRLARQAVFTLAEDVSAETPRLPVIEPTATVSTVTGFSVRNSVTLRIGEELVTFTGATREPPWAFTGCVRGALGTRAVPHVRGERVDHLAEVFGLFAPDGESSLLVEVAECTAELYNECGFDMMYLDALDGGDLMGRPAWHYEAKFVFELWKRLRRPALMEMSTFHPHLWFVRSRMGAWDYPRRGHWRFIDNHCRTNARNARMFMPSHLGWWRLAPGPGSQPDPHQCEPTYPEVIEYLCVKALGTDSSMALMGLDPESLEPDHPNRRLVDIVGRYERLRLARVVSPSVRQTLAELGRAFSLVESPDGRWGFCPTVARSVTLTVHGRRVTRAIDNPFAEQPLRLRIEALYSAAAWDDRDATVLAAPPDFPSLRTAPGVEASFRPLARPGKGGQPVACFTATNRRDRRWGAWAAVFRTFDPPLDLSERQAVGLWVFGDGRGAVLNVQVRSPEAVSRAVGHHYVKLDFQGWRYFELIEPEGERYEDYGWPSSGADLLPVPEAPLLEGPEQHWHSGRYEVYREKVQYRQVGLLGVWLNDLPPGEPTECRISAIRALPLAKHRIRHPRLALDGAAVTLPVTLETGQFVELAADGTWTLFDDQGAAQQRGRCASAVPPWKPGENRVSLSGQTDGGLPVRLRITAFFLGTPLADFAGDSLPHTQST